MEKLRELQPIIEQSIAQLLPKMLEFQRDIHAHPELARTEQRTTAKIFDELTAAGLNPKRLPGTGLVCDLGQLRVAQSDTASQSDTQSRREKQRVALRADIDALPVVETTKLPWASTVPGVTHACGHDFHTAIVLGVGLLLRRLELQGYDIPAVRLIFQPAEEVQPGGALDVIAAGALEGVGQMYGLHCEPKTEVGSIGTRIGAITSASDEVQVTLTAEGGHTSRPHLTGDIVYALGQIITQTTGVLDRRLDPRAGVNLTWGAVHAGQANNAIPATGVVKGTLRCLDVRVWEKAGQLLEETIRQVVAPYGVEVDVQHTRGVPPVENNERATLVLENAARTLIGDEAVLLTEQSLGGEDFAWYLTKVPGALARLGTRTPGGPAYDLHQGDLVVDDRALGNGIRLLAGAAYLA